MNTPRVGIVAMTVMLAASACFGQPRVVKKHPSPRNATYTADVAKKLIGTWSLVSIEDTGPNGKPTALPTWAIDPIGTISYDATGRMSAQIMNGNRAKFALDDNQKAAADEKRSACEGYLAYFGTYAVNEKESTIVHHVEGSLLSNEVGTDKKRKFEWSGDRLILTLTTKMNGEQITRKLVWERVR